jgi:hypothetical protein
VNVFSRGKRTSHNLKFGGLECNSEDFGNLTEFPETLMDSYMCLDIVDKLCERF